MTYDPNDLINWAEVSRVLAGDRASITRGRIPKKHEKKINRLIQFCTEWIDRYQKPPEL